MAAVHSATHRFVQLGVLLVRLQQQLADALQRPGSIMELQQVPLEAIDHLRQRLVVWQGPGRTHLHANASQLSCRVDATRQT
jgi:hypothetical protein